MRGFTDSEQILFMRVANCPNNGSGPCALAHNCVDYERDADGVLHVKERDDDEEGDRNVLD